MHCRTMCSTRRARGSALGTWNLPSRWLSTFYHFFCDPTRDRQSGMPTTGFKRPEQGVQVSRWNRRRSDERDASFRCVCGISNGARRRVLRSVTPEEWRSARASAAARRSTFARTRCARPDHPYTDARTPSRFETLHQNCTKNGRGGGCNLGPRCLLSPDCVGKPG
jgi:hypothetical protein